ncbi:MAG: thioredoxin [Oscillibacter sp.]|nr:thioredoxin [Oscillibacter sp.]
MIDMAISVNDSNFEETVLQAGLPVLVDFWAEWCGPCKMMLPIVEEVSKEYEGKLIVAKVDVDSSPATAARFGIRNIPTILFFKNGEVVDKQVGAAPKTSLVEKIKAVL